MSKQLKSKKKATLKEIHRRPISPLNDWSRARIEKRNRIDPLAFLSDERRWTAWNFIVEGDLKKKVPFIAADRKARSNDPSTWITRDAAQRLRDGCEYAGIGVFLGELPDGSLLAGLDIDTCRDPRTGELTPWALEAIRRFGSYTEISPSGTGVKIFFILLATEREAALRLFKGLTSGGKWSLPSSENHPPGFELYFLGRYFTVTGMHLTSTPTDVRPVALETIEWMVDVAGPALLGLAADMKTSPKNAAVTDELQKEGDEVLARLRASTNPDVAKLISGEKSVLKRGDQSRSAIDFALVGFAKDAGLTKDEARAAVYSFRYGAGRERHKAGDARYFNRMWKRARSGGLRTVKRPMIKVRPGDIHRAVEAAEGALIQSGLPIYQLGPLIVQTVRSRVTVSGGRTRIIDHLKRVSPMTMAKWMAMAARFYKFGGQTKKWTRVDCPGNVAATYLDGAEKNLPSILRVVTVPTMLRDGSILQHPGYDAVSRLLYKPSGTDFPPVPMAPTQADAKKARKIINKCIRDFPFVTEADRSVALSAILTPLVRNTLFSAPLHGFSAPAPGTGKSMLVDIAATIATGGCWPVTTQASREELEKRIGAALVDGKPIVTIDNCGLPVGGDLLCSALTQDSVSIRILSKTLNVEVPTCTTFYATGNNLQFGADMARRVLVCALDAKCERPEERVFKWDAVTYAAEHRAELVVAGLTILRAYKVAREPLRGKSTRLGSFQEWSDTVRDAIIWAGGADPCETQARVREADPEREQLIAVVEAWHAALGNKKMSAKDAIVAATNDNRTETRRLQDVLLETAGEGAAINSRKLGQYLAKYQNRIVREKRIVKCKGRSGILKWAVEKVVG